MKVEKLVIESAKTKENNFLAGLWEGKRKKNKEPKYDPTVKIWGSQEEHDLLHQVVRSFGYSQGLPHFIEQAFKNYKTLDKLIFPDVKDAAIIHYKTLKHLPEDERVILQNHAKKAGLDERDFVRAILYTTTKNYIDQQKAKEEESRKRHLEQTGMNGSIRIAGNLFTDYKKQYPNTGSQELESLLYQLLEEHLKGGK